ncbi:LPS translocon maturation chaperone LptM [Labrys wisconsinensis]|uniref:Small lipoprotein YifL n=1 Tax=Labrys wisconsinensis TaxID=425677 RepID=A0ABU0J477_9HYPH|nr:lipoprotein [Labrys wisconsinensis]MDQ0468223.1 putative small lipoprotein YifL [Labrys wisconsinensis]
MPRLALPLLLALAAAVALSGCGRQGKLEPPPEQKLVQGQDGKSKDPGPEKPKTSFFLDPLLN